jgi:hypothetical protein
MHHVFVLIIKDFSFTKDISNQIKGDYLMMAATWREIEEQGDTCMFYMVTMNTDIALKLNTLGQEFRHKGFLKMTFMTPDEMDYRAYFKKNKVKVSNVGGILVMEGGERMSDSDRKKMASQVGRTCMRRQLGYREEGLTQVKDKFKMPGNLDWDYYGIREI